MNHSLGIDEQKLLDAIADEFEKDWTPANLSRMKELVNRVSEKLKEPLIEMLMETEIELVCKNGATLYPPDYEALGGFAYQRACKLSTIGHADESLPNQPSSKKSDLKQIGPYKLLHQIGEGGMGTVWMAEQEKPVRRRVALKLIKNDVGNKETIARFEAERQALAIMNHQNIAKVLDAGTEESGQPYFVMELVKGVPITTYCDQNKLSINERLHLMVDICHAIQHAHQKGIIHRDLKPSNVLVSLYDGKPTPKIIDFGLAKALEHTNKLTDKTICTEFGKVVGTLQYMSPEQAEMNALDVDTRTDVYSLGVLLYELLTGTTPIEKQTMKQNLLQLLVYIKESEPPKPSTRLSSSGDSISGISDQRQITPHRLKSVLKGELDWIVMKALEKDRTRRYETASGFADDLTRYLNGEAVKALPPSRLYLLKKLIARNKVIVSAGATILFLLVIGLVGMSVLWINARLARKDAEHQQGVAEGQRSKAIKATEIAQRKEKEALLQKTIAEERQKTSEALLAFFQDDLFRLANPWELELASRGEKKDVSLRDVVESATQKFSPENFETSSMSPAAYYAILKGLGDVHEGMGNFATAEKLILGAYSIATKEFAESDPVRIEAGMNLSFIYLLRLKRPEAINQFFETYFTLQKLTIDACKEDATIEQKLVAKQCMLMWLNTLKRRIDYRFRTLPVWEPKPAELLKIKTIRILQVRGSLPQFATNLKKLFDEDHEVVLYALVTEGLFDFAFSRFEPAKNTFEKLLAVAEKKIEEGTMREDGVDLMGCRQVLALTYAKLKIKPDAQRDLARKNYEIMKARFSDSHPATLIAADFYAQLLLVQKRVEEAIPVMRDRSKILDKKIGPTSMRALSGQRALAEVLWKNGHMEEAFEMLTKRLKVIREKKLPLEKDSFETATISCYRLGIAAQKAKKYPLAQKCFQATFDAEKQEDPEGWSVFDTQSHLGEAQQLNGDLQQAEANLLAACEGLRIRQDSLPENEKEVYRKSVERVVRFYKAQSDGAKAEEWNSVLKKIPKPAKAK